MDPKPLSLSASETAPATTRPIRMAATLIVLRDGGEGLEVLLLRRAEKANDQNSGASVFPGGVLDAHDRGLHAHCCGLDDAEASIRLAVESGGLDFYAAAVRECFEEAGLLFACDAEGRLVTLDSMGASEQDAMREAASQGTDALLALCGRRGWRLAVDRLAYFSHWLTPPGMPRRFDTRFFVALMPSGQTVKPDGRETVDHLWLRPAEALTPGRKLKLMNVTRRILEQLSAFPTAQACMAYARALGRIPLVMPRVAEGPEGRRAVNVEEPAYAEIGHLDPDGKGDARYALEPSWVTRLSSRVLRVAGSGKPQAGWHSYFVGGDRNEWALIDPVATDDAQLAILRAAAPGPVRWILSTRGSAETVLVAQADAGEPWAAAVVTALGRGEQLDLGGASLRAIRAPSDSEASSFLLVEERMLFSGGHDPQVLEADAGFDWIAPGIGFLQAHT